MKILPTNFINSQLKTIYPHCTMSNAVRLSFSGSKLSPLEKDTVEFNKKESNKKLTTQDVINMSGEEFSEYRSSIKQKLNVHKKYIGYYNCHPITRNNALLLDTFLSNEKLYNSPIAEYITYITEETKTSEECEAKVLLMNKYLSDERLYSNDSLSEKMPSIIRRTSTNEHAQSRLYIINKYLSDIRWQIPQIKKYLGTIVDNTRYLDTVEAKIYALNILTSNEHMLNSKFLDKLIGLIGFAVPNLEIAKLKMQGLEKMFSDKKLSSNQALMEKMLNLYGDLFIDKIGEIEVLNKFVSDERLYNNPALANEIPTIVGFVAFGTAREGMPELLDRIAENNENFKDPDSVKKFLNLFRNGNYSRIYKYLKSNKFYETTAKSYKETLNMLEEIEKALPIMKELQLFSEEEIKKLEEAKNIIPDSLKNIITPAQITNEQRRQMLQGFFANNNPELEKTLQNADFTQYGKEGLPLKYSREDFLKDLDNALKDVSDSEKKEILNKLRISTIVNSLGQIEGYDGIITLDKLSSDGVEGKVLALANRFINENAIITGDEKLDNALNSLIGGMSEFINVIGKNQHETQNYSVDIHILKVLQEALKNSEYQNLSNLDKTCLKFAIIMHDIAKSEGIVDKSHPLLSALFAKNILEKYNLPIFINDRIFELIKNHHWLEEYDNKGNNNEVAIIFRHRNDFRIAKIMAEADLKGVSEEFYHFHKNALEENELERIQNRIDTINSSGQLVFTSKIIQKDKIPVVSYRGKDYQIINFTQIPDDTDLSEFGFVRGTKKDDLRLYIHMTDKAKNLKIVDILSDIKNGGFLCASYVSLNNCHTYYNMPFGVSLEAENVNIANASQYNQGSGGKKEFSHFVRILSDITYRQLIPEIIQKELNIGKEEYAQLYEQLSQKQYISQIREDDTYYVGDKKLDGKSVLEAVKKAQDGLLSNSQNESNLYNPKINAFVAKVDSIEEIPDDMLDFAHEYNLPIYILGSQK